ncbi:MAG: phosphate transport system protein [Desulfomicrobiaceae bacterium]|jgi:phosphate transport system protein|nr:phosphate signaling complex protein PhoU [Desulfomicrobiaceae bacterium]MDI3492941.1 phosphate transport system protein [Desulfomicrobiaceae bacterium]MDK2873764.1 phosphate transport system protein [Desulfomicrobiaceae bacterium]HCF05852.1 phosphate transport system regulatory protein PhoU [Desulfomicrobiaceae bacterium]
MTTHLHEEMERLRLQVLHMVNLAEAAVTRAIQAYVARDEFLAEAVVDGDAEVNALEVAIDEAGLKLLALEQPVASDLRFVLGCMRISVDLERIADEAVNIAERAMILSARPPLPFQKPIKHMGERALAMLRRATQAFVRGDTDLALDVWRCDAEIDTLNHRNMREVIEYMLHETPAIERSVHTILIVRHLERIADLVTNICESVVFIVKGINIKHKNAFDQR